MSNKRIKEIQGRLANVKGLKELDADDISHDAYIGVKLLDSWCELYANSKSDIEFLLAEIEKRDQKLAKAVLGLKRIVIAESVASLLIAETTIKEIGEENQKSFVDATKPAVDKLFEDINTRFNTLMAESYLKHKAESEGKE